jgi:choline dehydrogenase-like flavoprotein
MYYVVGSGPAGISCARALIAAGREVTILDAGLELDAERRQAVTALAASNPSSWDARSTAFLRKGMSAGNGGIPTKLLFGSDHPYREPSGATYILRENVDTKPSYSLGGLSTVWGGAVMPYRQQDIEDWPISVEDLAPSYKAVLSWMPLSARKDDLDELFPIHREDSDALPMSRQSAAMLADLERKRAELNKQGIYCGASRLAVDASGAEHASGCVRCGLCMYGCPYQLIYSSDQSLASFSNSQSRLLTYRRGVTVQSIGETAGGVTLHAVDAAGKRVHFEGERVFLASGVLNTTAILLRSLEAYGMPVQLRDSQYFLLPALRMRGMQGVSREPLHTLAQLFLEVFDTSISPYAVHLQTYTYNDLFRDRAAQILGPLRRFFPMEALLGRLILFQGYLHSAHSSSISAVLERTESGDVLRLGANPDPETKRRIGRLIRKLVKLSARTGVLPLSPLLEMGLPGRGFHSGGSFPMAAQPRPGESDRLGRPYGLQRIHAVDATVLPSIPATTITFTVMANAYRIGSAAMEEEGRL